MADYIERDMFLKIISHKPSIPITDREDRLINGFISAVKNCPAADVRPVVLCRDCKYWKQWDNTAYHLCTYVIGASSVRKADDFCSCGVKREES